MSASRHNLLWKRAAHITVWLALSLPAAFADTNRAALTPPLPLKSPVDSFRALLAMPVAERRQHLTNRTAETQRRLVEKIREYQALTPEERELRLTTTELRWYLLPLMRASPTNRAAQLENIPSGVREMVAARIEQWDQLAPAAQLRLLTNQQAAGYFAAANAGAALPVSPADQIRVRLQSRLNQMLELTDAEKARALRSLSEAERRQMEASLEAFRKLSPGQRKQCIASFGKFSEMSLAERQEFLKGAERWERMSPAERQSWRELVSAAPTKPPLPVIKLPTPPLPRMAERSGAPVATN
jgi:hypothetical protein